MTWSDTYFIVSVCNTVSYMYLLF